MKKLSTKHAPTLCHRVRAAKCMTQDEFAAFLGVHPQSVRKWEAGNVPGAPARLMLEMLAAKLKVQL